jgi:hypothetical protein
MFTDKDFRIVSSLFLDNEYIEVTRDLGEPNKIQVHDSNYDFDIFYQDKTFYSYVNDNKIENKNLEELIYEIRSVLKLTYVDFLKSKFPKLDIFVGNQIKPESKIRQIYFIGKEIRLIQEKDYWLVVRVNPSSKWKFDDIISAISFIELSF